MMDIVARLRRLSQPLDTGPGSMIHPLAAEAADEITRLRSLLQNGSPVVEGTIQHMAMQLAACQKDAERYRWLREQNALLEHDSFYVGIDDQTEPDGVHWVGSDLDAAIDAAMKEAQ